MTRISGLPQLRAALRKLATDVHQGAAAGVGEASEAVRDDVQERIAVNTGRARAGVEVRPSADGLSAEVGIWDDNLDYIEFPEHGTSSQPAQPSFQPAAEAARQELPRRVAERVRRRVS